jgi:EAL domain-containing protein (putative c-di-GMP-specific phosphodiesterase class I)
MNEAIIQSILSGNRQAITYVHAIVGLKDGATKAKEVLTRFPTGNGQMRTVGDLLEDVTLAPELRVQLDLLCLKAIFAALAEHPVTDHLMFVNLDPMTLEHPEFWNRIQPWLWDLSIPPHRIVFEITEAYSHHDRDLLEGNARRLRELSLRIAVDDLGSGIASLAHMARLTPDFIKVDKSLVRNVHRHPYQAALLNALAVFAERMRVGYIAEGIETTEELQAVIDADVPWGQGFIFGEPEPLRFPLIEAAPDRIDPIR